jgi:glycolate oxidase
VIAMNPHSRGVERGSISALRALPGFSIDEATSRRDQLDRSGYRPAGPPMAVVRASSEDEVEQVLRYANENLVPVVTRGAGTSLTGASTADRGEIVLDVSGMDEIFTIDAGNRMAIVGAGVITAELDAAAARQGLRYAPDPASVGISTIGGNIATNAGGVLGAKYGVTRDHVLELNAITGAGERLRSGRQTHKGVAGYDLTSLLVGSEGTLAVITRAAVKLRPAVTERVTMLASFPDTRTAAAAAQELLLAGLDAAAMELVDAPTLNAIARVDGELGEVTRAILLLQYDGAGAVSDSQRAEGVLGPLTSDVETTQDPVRADQLFAMRRRAIPSIELLGRVLIEDIVVPLPRLSDAIDGLRAIENELQTTIFVVAHAGDGNLHPMISVPGLEDGSPIPEAAWHVADRVFSLALNLGGSITGEHGVGLLKRDHVLRELGPVSLALHTAIKRVFDPRGILNPGKAF